MISSIKIFMALVLGIVGVAAFLVGYLKYGFLLKMIFGKERVNKTDKGWLALYLYIAAGVLLLLSLMLLIP